MTAGEDFPKVHMKRILVRLRLTYADRVVCLIAVWIASTFAATLGIQFYWLSNGNYWIPVYASMAAASFVGFLCAAAAQAGSLNRPSWARGLLATGLGLTLLIGYWQAQAVGMWATSAVGSRGELAISRQWMMAFVIGFFVIAAAQQAIQRLFELVRKLASRYRVRRLHWLLGIGLLLALAVWTRDIAQQFNVSLSVYTDKTWLSVLVSVGGVLCCSIGPEMVADGCRSVWRRIVGIVLLAAATWLAFSATLVLVWPFVRWPVPVAVFVVVNGLTAIWLRRPTSSVVDRCGTESVQESMSLRPCERFRPGMGSLAASVLVVGLIGIHVFVDPYFLLGNGRTSWKLARAARLLGSKGILLEREPIRAGNVYLRVGGATGVCDLSPLNAIGSVGRLTMSDLNDQIHAIQLPDSATILSIDHITSQQLRSFFTNSALQQLSLREFLADRDPEPIDVPASLTMLAIYSNRSGTIASFLHAVRFSEQTNSLSLYLGARNSKADFDAVVALAQTVDLTVYAGNKIAEDCYLASHAELTLMNDGKWLRELNNPLNPKVYRGLFVAKFARALDLENVKLNPQTEERLKHLTDETAREMGWAYSIDEQSGEVDKLFLPALLETYVPQLYDMPRLKALSLEPEWIDPFLISTTAANQLNRLSLAPLNSLTELRELYLPSVRTAGTGDFFKSMPHLEVLQISAEMADRSRLNLATCAELKRLNLYGKPSTALLNQLAELHELRQLVIVDREHFLVDAPGRVEQIKNTLPNVSVQIVEPPDGIQPPPDFMAHRAKIRQQVRRESEAEIEQRDAELSKYAR